MPAGEFVAGQREAALEQAAHLQRIVRTHRIGQADTIDAFFEHSPHEPEHLAFIDAALDRATEGRAHAGRVRRAQPRPRAVTS